MNVHDDYKAAVSALLDGELTDAERTEVLAHVSTCEECRTYLAELTALRAALGDLEPVEVPEGFAAGVLARLHEEKTPKPAKKAGAWRKWGALAACAAVVVLAVAVVPNMARKSAADAQNMTAAAPATPAALPPEPAGGASGKAATGDASDAGATEAEENMLTTQMFRTEAADAPDEAPAASEAQNGESANYDIEAEVPEPDLLLYGENAEFWLWNNGEWNEKQNGYWVDREALRHLPKGLTLGNAEMLARWQKSGDDFAFVRAAGTEANR